MKIQIEDNLYLESDSMQFMLRKYGKVNEKTGEPSASTIGYYPSLEQAINHLVKVKTLESNADTFSGLLQEIKDIKEYISSKIG